VRIAAVHRTARTPYAQAISNRLKNPLYYATNQQPTSADPAANALH